MRHFACSTKGGKKTTTTTKGIIESERKRGEPAIESCWNVIRTSPVSPSSSDQKGKGGRDVRILFCVWVCVTRRRRRHFFSIGTALLLLPPLPLSIDGNSDTHKQTGGRGLHSPHTQNKSIERGWQRWRWGRTEGRGPQMDGRDKDTTTRLCVCVDLSLLPVGAVFCPL